MRNYRTGKGPFGERPYFTVEEIERLCTDELCKQGLYPSKPEPIRIERFIEKRFGVTPMYEELPEGILGFTRFGAKGVESVVVARTLADDGGKTAERRISTTLAHEAGHGLLHAYLFVLKEQAASLFGADFDSKSPRILCRDDSRSSLGAPKYDGNWWEFQANQTIGALLLPKELAMSSLDSLLTSVGSLGIRTIKPESRAKAVKVLAAVFNVNPAVAKIRLDQMFPEMEAGQLTL